MVQMSPGARPGGRQNPWILKFLFYVLCDLRFLTLLQPTFCYALLILRDDALPATPLDLLSLIISYGEEVLPNLRIAMQILLIISVSIASCERSFSKLKLILSYLLASMGKDRLSNLVLLSVERKKWKSVILIKLLISLPK